MRTRDYFQKVVQATAELHTQLTNIDVANDILFKAWLKSKFIYTMGNGGSTAIADHFACDLMKWTSAPGMLGLRAQSLGSMPIVSAVANDKAYSEIFHYQLARLHRGAGDVVVAFSCSGNSDNIIRALTWVAGSFKIIVITGYTDVVRQVEESYKFVSKVIQKPFHTTEILEAAERVLIQEDISA